MSATLAAGPGGASAGLPHPDGATRRDLLILATAAMGSLGAAVATWPFIDSMNPARDTAALASIDVDLAPIAIGQAVTVLWRGRPVFIRHRTAADIAAAAAVPLDRLPDPEPDSARVQRPEWLVMIGVCTHLGCVPKGQATGDPKGDFGGWFCVCHGSHYDTAGRIRKGPAPRNLDLPPYRFLDDTTLRLG